MLGLIASLKKDIIMEYVDLIFTRVHCAFHRHKETAAREAIQISVKNLQVLIPFANSVLCRRQANRISTYKFTQLFE